MIGTEVMRKLWLVVLFILLQNACMSSAAARACEASSFITNAGNAFLNAGRRQSASAFSGVASRYTDLRGISMFALGPHRKLLGKAREAEYLALTRSFIGSFLAKYSNRFSGSGLKSLDNDPRVVAFSFGTLTGRKYTSPGDIEPRTNAIIGNSSSAVR